MIFKNLTFVALVAVLWLGWSIHSEVRQLRTDVSDLREQIDLVRGDAAARQYLVEQSTEVIEHSVRIADLLAELEGTDLVGRATDWWDGDTMTVVDALQREHKVRLHGVDAPERQPAMPYWEWSRDRLKELTAGQRLRIEVLDRDRYGRTVGIVFAEDKPEAINLTLLSNGAAWHAVKYDQRADWAAAEADARTAKRGLWVEPNPKPPWDARTEK